MPLRIIFMGTPEFSVPALSALVDAGHEIVAVYCQPPRPGGRGMGQKKSPVHKRAEELGIAVFTPTSLKSEERRAEFVAHNGDVAVVIAYGLILPQPILDAPRLGCFNAHASLLPRWRGAAPIQRAIEAGDKQSGVMIMQMEAGLDTGPVLIGKSVPISDNMTAGELHDQLSDLSAGLMVEAMEKLEAGTVDLIPQDEIGVSYAKKIEKSESRINWSQPARCVHNHIRAMSPFPGAWCEMELNAKVVRVKILQSEFSKATGRPGEVIDKHLTIACRERSIHPLRLQKAGKQPVSLEEFLRGNQLVVGQVLD